MSLDKNSFWDLNLNPITMLPTNVSFKKDKKELLEAKQEYVRKITDDLMPFKEAKEILGFGAKKIRSYAKSLGEDLIKTPLGSYYKKEVIEDIRKLIELENLNKKEDIESYISNTELMDMFELTGFKAWSIAKEHKLIKTKFNRNMVYYERQKAIEIFSKYKK